MKQPKNVKETLDICRANGMGVAIDDFGTGYSSLSYLHQYPIDTLKIDQSFIRKMRGDDSVKSLVKSIVALSESLNIRIIAEGVEEIEEAEFLQALNCGLAQGYLYSRPIEESQVLDLLNERNPA